MVGLRWLLVAVMAYVCVPGSRSECLNSSFCNNLSTERRIQNCIRFCKQKIRAELPQLTVLAPKTDEEKDLLLSIILGVMASSKDKVPGGTPHSNERRSYSMEHFRWGKPNGRKRRPIKVFTSALEGGGGSSEVGFPAPARRQLGGAGDESSGDLKQQKKGKQRAKVRSQVPQRKDGSYRMSHFRWGNPSTSKRDGSFKRSLEEESKAQLAKLFRNILHNDVQRG